LRLVCFMTFVTALLLLAMVPAVLQFARLNGLHPSSALATVGAACVFAVWAARRN
jgi:hypothetical protein